jgi:hypothetical protein
MRVANGISLGSSLLLPVVTVNFTQTLKAVQRQLAGTQMVVTQLSGRIPAAPPPSGTVRVFRQDCALEDAIGIPRMFA